MTTGQLKGIAEVWHGTAPVFRLLIGHADGTWQFIYAPASNYRFCNGDSFSWDENQVVWHSGKRDVVLCTRTAGGNYHEYH